MTSNLFAVLVIVHAGQSTVRVAINICVYTTCVSITSPANITLKNTEQKYDIIIVYTHSPSYHTFNTKSK